MHKKTIYIFFLFFLTTSCASLGEVKRGLTGEKSKASDEFLVQKKDPLVLPPDYANLPTPSDKSSEYNFSEALKLAIIRK